MEWHRLYPDGICRAMSDADARVGGLLTFAESLLGGVTTVVTMTCRPQGVLAAADECGGRAIVAPLAAETATGENDLYPEALAIATSEVSKRRGGRVRYWLGWDHMSTFSDDGLRRLGGDARSLGVGITGHASESKYEVEWARRAHGSRLVEYLDACGVLGPDTLLAHCVWVDDAETLLLARTGTSVSHNPTSNMKFGVGVAPLAAMRAAGVNVALGTDGMLSNFHLDMWEVIRGACMLQRISRLDADALSSWDALAMATRCGAKAIGLGADLGTIEEGRLADAILVDVSGVRFQPRARGRHDNLIPLLVWCARGSDVETVIVDGRVVVEGHRLLSVDEAALAELASSTTARLLARVDEADRARAASPRATVG
jgi:5-methylthioadenosine/S-adenosylhomocysteine deaminase